MKPSNFLYLTLTLYSITLLNTFINILKNVKKKDTMIESTLLKELLKISEILLKSLEEENFGNEILKNTFKFIIL